MSAKEAVGSINSEEIKPLNQDNTYNETLASLQNRMSPTSKAFSKLIHTPAVEHTSSILESTIMRPSVVMGTTWTALIVGVIFYVTARVYGFKLSGSEMLLALLGGAVLGLALEGIWMFFSRKQEQ